MMPSREEPPDGHPDAWRRADLFILLLILALTAIVRAIGIGHLGYWIDEDLTWLVSESIREHGSPLLPSGAWYLRGFPYSYLVAFFTTLFGTTPEVLRWPSLLCSLGTLTFVFLMVRDLAGRRAAFGVALLLAVSPWEFHYAQMARMYAIFAMLVAAALCFALRSLASGSRRAWFAACLATFLAIPIHQLGATLVLIFLIPLLFPADRRPSLGWMAGGVIAVALGTVSKRVVGQLVAGPSPDALNMVVDAGGNATRIGLPFVSDLTLNYAQWIVRDLWRASSVGGLVATLGFVAATIALVHLLRRTRSENGFGYEAVATWTAGGVFLAALLANQLVIAGLVAVALLKLLGSRAPLARSFRSLALIVMTAVAFLLLAQTIVHGPASLLDRQFLRLFFAIPVPFYRRLFEQQPVTLIVTLIGSSIFFVRSLRPGADQRLFGLLAFFWAALILMGMFRSPYVIHRYTYYLNPALVALFTLSVLALVDSMGQRWKRLRWLALGLGILIFITSEQFDPRQTWAAAHRGYGYERDRLSDLDLVSHFRYDYESCAQFVLSDRQPGDISFAKEPVEIYPYGLHCDFRLNALYGVYATRPDGSVVDWYLGIPIVSTAPDLKAIVAATQAAGNTVYVIYSKPSPAGPAIHLPPDVLETLASYDEDIVHQSRDGITVVVRLRPEND